MVPQSTQAHSLLCCNMASLVKSVGIVGCGTIGASWSALLLARGRRVVASDPAPNAEQKLRDYIGRIWPSLHAEKASIPAIPTAGLTFVDRLGPKELQDVDFVQEVSTSHGPRPARCIA